MAVSATWNKGGVKPMSGLRRELHSLGLDDEDTEKAVDFVTNLLSQKKTGNRQRAGATLLGEGRQMTSSFLFVNPAPLERVPSSPGPSSSSSYNSPASPSSSFVASSPSLTPSNSSSSLYALAQDWHHTEPVEEVGEGRASLIAALQRILENEQKYADALTLAVENFLVPLRTAAETGAANKIISKDDIPKLFSNIEIIMHVEGDLLKDLSQELQEHLISANNSNNNSEGEQKEELPDIGKVFLKHIPYMHIYPHYVTNAKISRWVLNKYVGFFTKNSSGVELASLLSKPVTRVDYYYKQLQALSKGFPQDSQLYKNLTEAIQKLGDLCAFFSQHEKDTVNLNKINMIAQLLVNYPGEFLVAGRVLVREGDLGLLVGPNKKTYRFFLFNDLLMWVKPTLTKQLKFKGQIELRTADIITRSQSFSTRNLLSQKNSPRKTEGGGGGGGGFGFSAMRERLFFNRDREQTKQGVGSSASDIKNAIQVVGNGNMISICADSFPEREAWLGELLRLVNYFYERRVFGVALTELAERKQHMSNGIPSIIRKCCEFYEYNETAMRTEGIFRISDSKLAVDSYKREIDDGNEIKFSTVRPHMPANLIKQFFRDLPEPLFTYTLHEKWIKAANDVDTDSKIAGLKACLADLPEEHRALVAYMMSFIRKISMASSWNKMGTRNLALVLEPNFVRRKSGGQLESIAVNGRSVASTTSVMEGESVIETLLEYYDVIFSESNAADRDSSNAATPLDSTAPQS